MPRYLSIDDYQDAVLAKLDPTMVKAATDMGVEHPLWGVISHMHMNGRSVQHAVRCLNSPDYQRNRQHEDAFLGRRS